EELGVIVTSHSRMEADGDSVHGELTELGAQLLLVHDGQHQLTPLQAAGTFQLWLRDGRVARYQVKLTGRLAIETPAGRHEVDVRQSTLTVLKSIGSTTVDVPEEARRKLTR